MRTFAAIALLVSAAGFFSGCCGSPCSPCCPEPVYQSPCCPAPSGAISGAPMGGGNSCGSGGGSACGAGGKACGK